MHESVLHTESSIKPSGRRKYGVGVHFRIGTYRAGSRVIRRDEVFTPLKEKGACSGVPSLEILQHSHRLWERYDP